MSPTECQCGSVYPQWDVCNTAPPRKKGQKDCKSQRLGWLVLRRCLLDMQGSCTWPSSSCANDLHQIKLVNILERRGKRFRTLCSLWEAVMSRKEREWVSSQVWSLVGVTHSSRWPRTEEYVGSVGVIKKRTQNWVSKKVGWTWEELQGGVTGRSERWIWLKYVVWYSQIINTMF